MKIQSNTLTKAQLVEMLNNARERLLTSARILLDEGLIEEEEDFAENNDFCETIHVELSPEDS